MASSYLDIRKFVEEVKGKDYEEIIVSAQREATVADKRRSYQYAEALKGLLYFLRGGGKPGGVDDYVFLSFRPIVEALVRKGQLKEEALQILDKIG